MLRTVAAGFVFALIYGVAIRLYLYLRAQRDFARWHPRAVLVAASLGGVAFYSAQQIRQPHTPSWRDLAAFLIMTFAAAAIPAILDTAQVVQARLLRRTQLRAPASQPPRDAP